MSVTSYVPQAADEAYIEEQSSVRALRESFANYIHVCRNRMLARSYYMVRHLSPIRLLYSRALM